MLIVTGVNLGRQEGASIDPRSDGLRGDCTGCYNNHMAQPPDVLILGGGVIGLTVAYSLARERVRVAVVDRGDFGQESSWAGAGIIPPGNPRQARTPFDLLLATSSEMFGPLSQELRERTGLDNG